MRFQIFKTSQDDNIREDPPYKQATFDADNNVWSVDINNISQLLRIANTNNSFNPGEIVISYGSDLEGYVGNIEIYDHYRE